MNDDEKDAVRAALRRIFEQNINPYGLAAESLARGLARERAEAQEWSRYLPGHFGPTATAEIDPRSRSDVRIHYAPEPGGDLGGGEIVRSWVPFGAGKGSYSSVLVIAEQDADRFIAVRLSTTSHSGDHRYFPIGAGPKDAHGRLSWADLNHAFVIHTRGVRRTGFTMDRDHFIRIADELFWRYAWRMDD